MQQFFFPVPVTLLKEILNHQKRRRDSSFSFHGEIHFMRFSLSVSINKFELFWVDFTQYAWSDYEPRDYFLPALLQEIGLLLSTSSPVQPLQRGLWLSWCWSGFCHFWRPGRWILIFLLICWFYESVLMILNSFRSSLEKTTNFTVHGASQFVLE